MNTPDFYALLQKKVKDNTESNEDIRLRIKKLEEDFSILLDYLNLEIKEKPKEKNIVSKQ